VGHYEEQIDRERELGRVMAQLYALMDNK